MELKEYQEKAQNTLALTKDDIMHMILGMLTELGELSDGYKKALAYGKPLDLVNIKEEIGDLMWYIANFCNIHDWDLGEILQTNIDKLSARYPKKFTEENALNRNLDKERKILEGSAKLELLDDRELLDFTEGL